MAHRTQIGCPISSIPYTGVTWRFLDLFAGCGGLSEGLRQTGKFVSVGAVEMDRDAADTYRLNFGDHVVNEPIEEVHGFPTADVIVGGPPCQGFSPLNRAGIGWERRALWKQYLRALDDVRPHAFIMENVPQLLASPEYESFETEARKRGYSVNSDVLNMADFGVPQTRKRAFVVGSLSGVIPWPAQTHRAPGDDHGDLPEWRTFADGVAGLPRQPDGNNWHRKRNPRPESIIRYRAVPANGGNRFEMQRNLDAKGMGHLVPNCWRNKPTGTTDVFGRLWWDRPSVTIRTEFFKPEKGRYLHPTAHRPITIREAARCMSFPDEFKFPEEQSMTSVARQVGNAVPPRMASVLGAAVAAHLDRTSVSARAA